MPVGTRTGGEAAIADGAIGQHSAEQRGDCLAVGLLTQQVGAPELAPELLADLGGGESKAAAEQASALGNEGLSNSAAILAGSTSNLRGQKRPLRTRSPAAGSLAAALIPPDAKTLHRTQTAA